MSVGHGKGSAPKGGLADARFPEEDQAGWFLGRRLQKLLDSHELGVAPNDLRCHRAIVHRRPSGFAGSPHPEQVRCTDAWVELDPSAWAGPLIRLVVEEIDDLVRLIRCQAK